MDPSRKCARKLGSWEAENLLAARLAVRPRGRFPLRRGNGDPVPPLGTTGDPLSPPGGEGQGEGAGPQGGTVGETGIPEGFASRLPN
ncbi:hypothetical protein JCM30394_25440 [Deferrisoma palaeochoriense]